MSDTQVFTDPTPDTALADDAFVVRYRLPNPFGTKRSRSEAQTLAKRRRQAQFLHAYAKFGIVADGLKAARVTYSAFAEWRTHDSKFADLFEQCSREANDNIVREVARRALEGWDETTTIVEGAKTYKKTVRRFDSNLLALLAKSRMREFRQEKVNATLHQTNNNLAVVPIERLSDEEFALLGRIMGKAGTKALTPGSGE